MHGVFLIMERLGLSDILDKLPRICRRLYVLFVVNCLWVFFRASDTPQALSYLKTMLLSFDFRSGIIPLEPINTLALGSDILIALFSLKTFSSGSSHTPSLTLRLYLVNALFAFTSIFILYTGTRNPFIYFNF